MPGNKNETKGIKCCRLVPCSVLEYQQTVERACLNVQGIASSSLYTSWNSDDDGRWDRRLRELAKPQQAPIIHVYAVSNCLAGHAKLLIYVQ